MVMVSFHSFWSERSGELLTPRSREWPLCGQSTVDETVELLLRKFLSPLQRFTHVLSLLLIAGGQPTFCFFAASIL